MKKKILTISIVLTIIFLIIAVVFFFLMKKADLKKDNDSEEYDVGTIIEEIEFLNFKTYTEIEEYAEEYPIYIQTSNDKTMFAVGELYIKDSPVRLFYKLNDDGTIKRFDGQYTYVLNETSSDEVWNVISYFNFVVVKFFGAEHFEHSMYDKDGAMISAYDENSYKLMLNGQAEYNLSVIDEANTYWNISAVVTEKKHLEFDFFRCYDLNVYDDDSPNIDLRIPTEAGE